MRVAQVIGKLANGGVEAVVNNYYQHTDTERFQFDYYIDEDSQEPPQEMIRRGARYYRIPSSRHLMKRIRTLMHLFRDNNYGIVHAHMNTLNAPVLYAAWRAGVPVRISHNHSTASDREWRRALVKKLLRATGSWFATDRMACGEAAGRWFFGRRLFDSGRVFVLPNAIDPEKYRFDPEARQHLRDALGAKGRLVIGHAGRFMPQKNHAFLLRAFRAVLARNPRAVLWLVGDGELQPQIRKLAGQLGISGSVLFLGARDDLSSLYSAMDCFMLPSLYEGVPLVGVEAQAAGLPCFFSDHVSTEVAYTERAFFISLKVHEDVWADAIADVVPASQAQRAKAAGRLEGTLFDLRESGRTLERYYESCMGRSAGNGKANTTESVLESR